MSRSVMAPHAMLAETNNSNRRFPLISIVAKIVVTATCDLSYFPAGQAYGNNWVRDISSVFLGWSKLGGYSLVFTPIRERLLWRTEPHPRSAIRRRAPHTPTIEQWQQQLERGRRRGMGAGRDLAGIKEWIRDAGPPWLPPPRCRWISRMA